MLSSLSRPVPPRTVGTILHRPTNAKPSRPSTRSLRQTGCPRSLPTPGPAADDGYLVRDRPKQVKDEIVDDKDGPGPNREKTEKDLSRGGGIGQLKL